ncbi:Trp biosynthesis-associated membrane protein [Agromyces allii]|uniref:Trp biosynthesis-associated membrane protein n=1 Tax=Agromyces allii TaxID=393607 RepID=A0ABN2QGC4_9MICO|nr:Trp biosynthesis-associated membrane protein [Agromyces allii]
MSGGRLKSITLLLALVGAGLALLSWSQTWFELRILDPVTQGGGRPIEVGGGIASPALAALGLAGLALVAALAIAGPFIRVVLAVIQVLLGGSIVLASVIALGDPVKAVAPAVTDATGVAGAGPTAELVASVEPTVWPWIAIAGGVLVVGAAIAALVTGARWPGSSRRYSTTQLADADAAVGDAHEGGGSGEAPEASAERALPETDARRRASDRAVDAWDELSRGDDPTDDLAAETPAASAVEPGGDGATRDGRESPTEPSR